MLPPLDSAGHIIRNGECHGDDRLAAYHLPRLLRLLESLRGTVPR